MRFQLHQNKITRPSEAFSNQVLKNFWLTIALQLNLDRLLARMWEEMGLVRVYTKPQGQQPDFSDPVVLSTVSGINSYLLLLILSQLKH